MMPTTTAKKSTPAPGSLRAISGGLLISVISTVVCLAFLEVMLRVIPFSFVKRIEERQSVRQGVQEPHPKGLYTIHPAIGWTLSPGFKGRFVKPGFDILVEANKNGLRDRDYGPKPEGVRRILGLGDSFAFGWGVENERGFYKVLETKLNGGSDKAHIEVINAGIPGFGTFEALNMLKEAGMAYEPDLVVLAFYEGNDYKNNGDAPRNREIRDGYLADVTDGKFSFVKFLSDRSVLAAFLESRIASFRTRALFSKHVARSKEYLAEMKAFLAGKDIPFVLVFIPDQDEAVYNRSAWLRHYDRLVGGMDLFQARTEIEKFCRENGIAYYKLSEAFENTDVSGALRLKDTHFNERGHEKAAGEIFQFLTKTFKGKWVNP